MIYFVLYYNIQSHRHRPGYKDLPKLFIKPQCLCSEYKEAKKESFQIKPSFDNNLKMIEIPPLNRHRQFTGIQRNSQAFTSQLMNAQPFFPSRPVI